eukprot:TRINITY_DN10938_c0_g3_i1.p1 TRINITY_DN10938_c0_g3~~TRINITY_DN10938_c0_g3_i1.p1  ORF type:complete len:310 (-),score=36.06 TRINITY_DN10938_c0_g3_i1:255-1184(-)
MRFFFGDYHRPRECCFSYVPHYGVVPYSQFRRNANDIFSLHPPITSNFSFNRYWYHEFSSAHYLGGGLLPKQSESDFECEVSNEWRPFSWLRFGLSAVCTITNTLSQTHSLSFGIPTTIGFQFLTRKSAIEIMLSRKSTFAWTRMLDRNSTVGFSLEPVHPHFANSLYHVEYGYFWSNPGTSENLISFSSKQGLGYSTMYMITNQLRFAGKVSTKGSSINQFKVGVAASVNNLGPVHTVRMSASLTEGASVSLRGIWGQIYFDTLFGYDYYHQTMISSIEIRGVESNTAIDSDYFATWTHHTMQAKEKK